MATTRANLYNYVDASIAKAIDEDLMRNPGFSIDQLRLD